MKLKERIYQHLIDHQEITYPELVILAKQAGQKVTTGNRYLQSDKGQGRRWNWLKYDQFGKLIKANQAWFKKRLRKPLKKMTVFKKK